MLQTRDFSGLSLMDALDLAILVEEEARDRYEAFTRLVGGRYPGDADDAFRTMAAYEQRHASELAERRKTLFGDAPSRVTREDFFEVEAPTLNAPRVFMSPRQALEVALRSEEKAHDFYAEAARHVEDAEVKALFEELREEERHHQELVRRRIETLPQGPDVEEEEADAPGSDPGN